MSVSSIIKFHNSILAIVDKGRERIPNENYYIVNISNFNEDISSKISIDFLKEVKCISYFLYMNGCVLIFSNKYKNEEHLFKGDVCDLCSYYIHYLYKVYKKIYNINIIHFSIKSELTAYIGYLSLTNMHSFILCKNKDLTLCELYKMNDVSIDKIIENSSKKSKNKEIYGIVKNVRNNNEICEKFNYLFIDKYNDIIFS